MEPATMVGTFNLDKFRFFINIFERQIFQGNRPLVFIVDIVLRELLFIHFSINDPSKIRFLWAEKSSAILIKMARPAKHLDQGV
jgi:hypothetical protein